MVTFWDDDARLLWANKFGEGWTPENAYGTRPWEFCVDEAKRHVVVAAWQQCITFGEISTYEISAATGVYTTTLSRIPIELRNGGATVVGHGRRVPCSCKLSDREREILKLLGLGQNPVMIADELGISAKTAQNHLARIRDRLGLRDQIELVAFAARSGA